MEIKFNLIPWDPESYLIAADYAEENGCLLPKAIRDKVLGLDIENGKGWGIEQNYMGFSYGQGLGSEQSFDYFGFGCGHGSGKDRGDGVSNGWGCYIGSGDENGYGYY